ERAETRALVSITECGESNDRPCSGMGVLAAVFPDAGRIALDVSGIERRAIKRRREEQRQTVVRVNELLVHGGHGTQGASRIRRPGEYAPRLRDRVDPAFVARVRAERRSIVVIAAPVPFAVPTVSLKRSLQPSRVRAPLRGARLFTTSARQRRERAKRRVQEPAEPDALAFALLADPVHTVVPVARADQRQAVFADAEAPIEPAPAVLEEGRGLVRGHRLEVRIVFPGPQRLAFEE